MEKLHSILLKPLLLLLMLFLIGCTETMPPMPTVRPTVTLISLPTRPLPTATADPDTATAPSGRPTITATSGEEVTPSGDRAAFISETYPDNSVLTPGESFSKAFELHNSGSATWTTDYALVRDETKPTGETLGAAERVGLTQTVAPGESLTVEIPLVAPEETGTYTVYWTLQDMTGAVVPVDGVQRIWATILVCEEGQDCSAPAAIAGGGSTSASGVSISYTGVSHDESITYVGICITIEDPQYNQYIPSGQYTSLVLDGTEISNRGGSTIGMPTGEVSCWNLKFYITPETYNQADHVSLKIERIEGNWKPLKSCNEKRPILMAQYPGLSFDCRSNVYYVNLRLPVGMTEDEADQIIMDAFEGAIYGLWEFVIK